MTRGTSIIFTDIVVDTYTQSVEILRTDPCHVHYSSTHPLFVADSKIRLALSTRLIGILCKELFNLTSLPFFRISDSHARNSVVAASRGIHGDGELPGLVLALELQVGIYRQIHAPARIVHPRNLWSGFQRWQCGYGSVGAGIHSHLSATRDVRIAVGLIQNSGWVNLTLV